MIFPDRAYRDPGTLEKLVRYGVQLLPQSLETGLKW